MPASFVAVHLVFLAGVAVFAHHPVAFIELFLMFLGFTQAYERHQNPLIMREALLVGFFLAGLVCSAACSSGGCSRSSPACYPGHASTKPWA